FEIVVGRPYVSDHARVRWSELAFLAEYRPLGRYGDASVKRAGSSKEREQYTSSVETWWKRPTSLFRHASSRTAVPRMLVRTNGRGFAIARSLWDSTARLRTRSASWSTVSNTAESRMSASTNK